MKWYGEQINCKILDYLPSSIWCRVTNVKPESIFMALLCLLWQFLTWISWLPSGLCSKFALWDGERPLKAMIIQIKCDNRNVMWISWCLVAIVLQVAKGKLFYTSLPAFFLWNGSVFTCTCILCCLGTSKLRCLSVHTVYTVRTPTSLWYVPSGPCSCVRYVQMHCLCT